jgi:hypothetical protein
MTILKKGKSKILGGLTKMKENLQAKKAQIVASGRATGTKIDEWIAKIDILLADASKDEENITKSKEQMKKCIKATAVARSVSWCLACGATGGTLDTTNWFNDTTNKINVKQATCETLVDACGQFHAIFKKIRAADLMIRKMKKAMKNEESTEAPSTEEENTDAELQADATCSADIATCKSDQTKRQAFCNAFQINMSDTKVFGDQGLGKNDTGDIPSATTLRILQASASAGVANEDATNGQDVANMDSGFQFNEEDFNSTGIVMTIAVTVLAFFNF